MSCHGTVKGLMFFVNFIFSLIGIAIFVVGVLGIFYTTNIKETYNIPFPSYVAPGVMTIGTIVFFISFSGCCGAIKEINCLLGLYIVVMLLLALAKIAIAIYLLLNKTAWEDAGNKILNEFDIAEDSPFHMMEAVVKCCGTTGPNSYIDAKVKIPSTCCPVSSEACLITNENIYKEGCKENAPQKFNTFLNTAIYSLIGIAVFELLSMMSAMYLMCYRRKGGDYYEYD